MTGPKSTAALWLGTFLAALDGTIVATVSLPYQYTQPSEYY
jgi:hypothetical protein